jgi:hypothetical protein
MYNNYVVAGTSTSAIYAVLVLLVLLLLLNQC